MVRETRHLWVGNLPDNIREDRIRDHFKRYGRVQSVKIFSRKGGGECDGNGLVGCGAAGICATVSFMDIKSASKAHNNEHKLDEHLLTTEYHEPGPIPSASPASNVPSSVPAGTSPVTQATPPSLRHPPPYSSPRFTHGPSEDITTFDRSSHFYERREGTENYVRRPPSAYHVVSPSESLRSRTRERDRLYRNGPPHYTPILESVVARTPATHHRTVTTTSWNSYEGTTCARYPASVVTTPEILSYQEERRESTPVIIVHKKHPKSRRKCRVMNRCGSNGSESVSNNSDSSRSRSHSSSSSSHSRSSSSSSDSSSAAISERSCSTHSHHGSLKSTVTVHSTISTPLNNCSPVVHTDDRRPLAICVRNLPSRSSDSSVKDGLYHEYKKHGKVTNVKVVGQGANRYAIVCFKKADDVDKAMQVSHDKLLFGSKIDVCVYHGFDVEDSDLRHGEAELDEYHPKATRTLFIGNLEKDVTVSDLRNTFQKFGEIIDIDIRKQGTTCYAFCQYCDISSVVKAMNAMDGEYLGNNKINLGYGKSLATNCLWVAGVADCVTEKQLIGSFSQFGHVTHVDINRSQGKALVFFQQPTHAQAALSQMRGYNLKNRRLMADYASAECQENFYEHYEKSKSITSAYENSCQDSPRSTGSTRGLDTPVSSTSSNGGNIVKHSFSNSNSSSNANNNIVSCNSSSNNGSSSSVSKTRFQHTLSTSRTTPTHQSVQQMPSSNSASPIVNNTPSPSPSTSSRSTPRPQQASRFDYTNALECSSDQRISRSFEDLNLNIENCEKPFPNPQDDVTLQKERVSLLEQLNNYSSSEDEEEEEELASLKQQNALHQQRSTSREESRPGTPLCDERPENILAHYESRRAAKEKNTNNTPLSLPLPSFANKVARSTSPTERSSKSPHLTKSLSSRSFDGARNSSLSSSTRQSPSPHIKDKPSILDSKLSSITPFDSLTETLKAPWIEQLKSLDEKYEKWTGTRSRVLTGKLDTSAVQTKHKLLDVNSIGRQRSEICQTVLSRKSVFDDHFKRLETITDQPPSDFIPPRVSVNNSTRSHSIISTVSSLPNLSPKAISTTNSGVSSFVMKGLQYPFPSHPPPPKSALSKINTSFALTKTLPDTLQPNTAPVLGSNPRAPLLLLRNNSVEKLTDLPKNSSPVTAGRETLSRLDVTCTELKKEILSPCGSRRSSVESIGRKSIDEDFIFRENKKLPDSKALIVNHVEAKTKINNTFDSCKSSVAEKENSVLDKRKTSFDKSLPEPSVVTSPVFHPAQRDKLTRCVEDDSESEKLTNCRRSSIESSTDDDRPTANKSDEKLRNTEKKCVETINHTKVKINDTRPDLKLHKSGESKREMKSLKSESIPDEEKPVKTVSCNHVDDAEDFDKEKDDKKKDKEFESSDEKEGKSDIAVSCSGLADEDDDEDDDDSNDIDENQTITVKNKIIETVFHIKHEKRKSIDSKSEVTDEKTNAAKSLEKKSSSDVSYKSKDVDAKRDANCDGKTKKECIKTKEFNMFENKPLEKKKNHFLSEPRKSVELDGGVKDDSVKNNKYKDKECKEKDNVEQSCERTKIDKKKEKHGGESKHKEIEKRKSEEKRDETKSIVAPEPEKYKSEDKYMDRKYEVHKNEIIKKEKDVTLSKPKEIEKEASKEKKKEKMSGQPENGKIKHNDYNKKYKEQENHKQKLVNERLEMSKERKNSSGSSSLSDSVPSRSKLSSFDSLESNNEEKSRHNSIDNESHVSKKFDRHRNNSIVEPTSGKEEKKSDSGRSKKLEKSNSSAKRKKSKKRKTLSDSSSDSEFESFDENKLKQKNHSIFDVVLDEPAYISMYDKVKARSTKNLQKQEEEKRQEKLKEKFSQLKQSRVKREEKKRSTSYDDDTDQERTVSRKGNKLILDSSDEEHSGTDKVKVPVQTDSSDDERLKKKMNSEGENETKIKYKKAARRSLNAKNKEKMKHLLTDTSEDEMKLKQKRDQQFSLMSENKRKFKRNMSKKRPSSRHTSDSSKKKSETDVSDDEKLLQQKSKSFYATGKIEAKTVYSDFSDDDDEDDVVERSTATKLSADQEMPAKMNATAIDPFVKRSKPKNDLKAMIEKGELNRVDNFTVDHQKSKMRMLISDVSEEEELKPNVFERRSAAVERNNFLAGARTKFDQLLSDTSENESVKSNRFVPKSTTSDLFGDDGIVKQEEKSDELFNNLAELHHDFVKSENLSPPPLLDPMSYDINEFQKKKSHKKKQKRQKSREHSVDRIKKHSKKDRRKSIPSDACDDETKEKEHKPKKKKKNRNKIKSVENLEEDIFGSMSDDSEKLNDSTKLSKLSVSDVYDADSDSSNKDVRETGSNSLEEPSKFTKIAPDVDGLNMLNSTEKLNSYENFFDHIKSKKKKRKKSKEEKSSKHHHHHHHHHHNHHHSKPVEKSDVPLPPLVPSPIDSGPPTVKSQSFEFDESTEKTKDDDLPDALKERIAPKEAIDIVTSSIAESIDEEMSKETRIGVAKPADDAAVKSISSGEEKSYEKSGADNDGVRENIHERAVMSISQALTESSGDVVEPPVRSSEEKLKTVSNAAAVDDKTDITISQEETEDAVAAILGESSEFQFNDCYAGDAMKPETPSSEHGLQIDTDTEEPNTSVGKSDVEDLVDEEPKFSSDDSFVTVAKGDGTLDETVDGGTPSARSKNVSVLSEIDSSSSSHFVTSEEQSIADELLSPAAPMTQEPEVPTSAKHSVAVVPKNGNAVEGSVNDNAGAPRTDKCDVKVDDPVRPSVETVVPKTEESNQSFEKPEKLNVSLNDSSPNTIEENSNVETVKVDSSAEKMVGFLAKNSTGDSNKDSFVDVTKDVIADQEVKERALDSKVVETLPAIERAKDENPTVRLPEKRTLNNCTVPSKSTHHLPNNFLQISDRPNLTKVEPSFSYCRNIVARGVRGPDEIKVNEMIVTEEANYAKRHERKRSYVECNGPSNLRAFEKEKLSSNDSSSASICQPDQMGQSKALLVVESLKNVAADKRSVESDKFASVTEKLSCDNTLKSDVSVNAMKKTEFLFNLKEPPLTDHTYNTVVKKPPTPTPEPGDTQRAAKDTAFRSVIIERFVENESIVKVSDKDDMSSKTTSLDDAKPAVVTDTDLALKQKLPIPAQQNTEPLESKEMDKSSSEVNEANKENIVKAAINQDNVSESNDDSKLNVILKNKEIIRSVVEDEIFRGVANDFVKCNHKMPENNRNILEKVVQRIHESKRIVQKTEEYAPVAANVSPVGGPDKVVLATEDEIKSAEILLKMSESTVIKSQVVNDYNCVIKMNHDHQESMDDELTSLKSDDKDTGYETAKNDSFSSCDLPAESHETVVEMNDETSGVESGAKVTDHMYNAKRGRRRKAAAPGGVVTRRGKQNNVTKDSDSFSGHKIKKSSADVYEFKEDSEDEVKRPRLILTIKSPIEPPALSTSTSPTAAATVAAVSETSVITETKSASPVASNVTIVTSTTTTTSTTVTSTATAITVSPSTPKAASPHTRKSRRLQEKEGGPRSTVDAAIVVDKVAKTAQSPRPTRRTTRIAAQAAAAIITTVHESTRKSTRSAKKPTIKSETAQPAPVVESLQTTVTAEDDDDDFPASPSASSAPSTSPSAVVPSSPVSARTSTEPTNLIDPVSGLLIPMKEAEEGQYVPVLTDLNQSQKTTAEYPPEKKARWDDLVEESALSLVKTESSANAVSSANENAGVITATVATSVIASVPSAAVVKTLLPTPDTSVPAVRATASAPAIVEDGPISLIKTTTASIITPAAALKSHAVPPHTVGYSQPYSVYAQSQSAAKLHTSKTIIPQPRVLTPITPKALVIQPLNADNDNHSNDEVPYPPQYSSPLLHGAVASPPLGSPKISPQPIVTGANNSRGPPPHSAKNMGPLEPLKIDPSAGFYYMQNISPQPRPALSVQSPSPQPRVIHNSAALNTSLLPPAVQSGHYIHPPQFIYQPYMQEPSLTPYHLAPPSQSSSAAAANAKIITDREIIDGRQPAITLSVTPSPPLELRKRTSPRPRVNDSPLITSPYVQSSRAFYYDEPHRPLQNRIRVSTPPYASKVPPQTDPVDMYVPSQSRLHMETMRYVGHVPSQDDEDDVVGRPPRTTFVDSNYSGPLPMDARMSSEGELDYSKRNEIALCDGAVPRLRDSPGSEMESPPLGDSPPQGNLDGTVLVQMYPIIWQGLLALKNDSAAVQMHVVSGNTSVAYDALPKLQDGYQPLLRIAQRMRLEQAQLDGVNRKMEIKDEHCTILGLPCGKNQEDVVHQATNLESCIIPYLQQKKAAGIINTAAPGTQQAAFVVHVFPPCEFADNVLLNAAPDLYRKVQETAYLVCIIVTV